MILSPTHAVDMNENLKRLVQAIQEDPNYDTEEIKELIVDATSLEIYANESLFLQLCHTLTEALVKTKRSVSGIRLISMAITKYGQHRSQLTPLHSDLCLLCLDAKCLNPALTFLEIDYTYIKRTDGTFTASDDVKRVLQFFYYGGLIYAAMKNYERASFFFEIVLTIPATCVNSTMQETYKKFIITNLLLNGKLNDNILPKYTSQCVTRQRKQLNHPYLKFAVEYASMKYDKISHFVMNNTSAFERDENMGLIKQCLTQVHRRNIQRLTKTFLTLPLRDVATYVGLQDEREAELHILNMIDDGEISATINQKDGMVVFRDNTEKYDSISVLQRLQEDMASAMSLITVLKKMEGLREGDTNRAVTKMSSDAQ